MNAPKRHHYLPEFYQKRWTVGGKIKVYRRFSQGLSINSKSPKAVGFEFNLYATEDLEGLDRYLIEREVLRNIDNDAARSLFYFESNLSASPDQRLIFAWTQFLLTLLHRSPGRIAEIKKSISVAAPSIFDDVKAAYPNIADDEIARILTDKKVREGVYQSLLQQLFFSVNVGTAIQKMNWCIIKVNSSKHEFLTCDKPLISSNGLVFNNSFLILPITRNSLFVACHDKRIGEYFTSLPPNKMVALVNDIIVRQAEKFVISSNETQTRFIENRLLVQSRQPNRDAHNEVRWEIPGLFRLEELKRLDLGLKEE